MQQRSWLTVLQTIIYLLDAYENVKMDKCHIFQHVWTMDNGQWTTVNNIQKLAQKKKIMIFISLLRRSRGINFKKLPCS
jgi:hypothetical protein